MRLLTFHIRLALRIIEKVTVPRWQSIVSLLFCSSNALCDYELQSAKGSGTGSKYTIGAYVAFEQLVWYFYTTTIWLLKTVSQAILFNSCILNWSIPPYIPSSCTKVTDKAIINNCFPFFQATLQQAPCVTMRSSPQAPWATSSLSICESRP